MKVKFKIVGLVITVIIVFVSFVYFAWNIQRKINYNLSYKSMVEQTVEDMVKKECLKQ